MQLLYNLLASYLVGVTIFRCPQLPHPSQMYITAVSVAVSARNLLQTAVRRKVQLEKKEKIIVHDMYQ